MRLMKTFATVITGLLFTMIGIGQERIAEIEFVEGEGYYLILDEPEFGGLMFINETPYDSVEWCANCYGGESGFRFMLNGKYGFCDSQGYKVLDANYDANYIPKYLRKELEVFESNGLFGVRTTDGLILVEAIYTEIECCTECFWGEIGFQVKENGKIGFLNQRAEMVVAPLYDEVGFCWMEVLLPVKLEENWGFINEAGEVVGEIKYNTVKDFSHGFASVNFGGKKETVTVEEIDEWTDEVVYKDVIMLVDTKWGVINVSGQLVVPCMYEEPIQFESGAMVATAILNGKFGLIDQKGNEVTGFIYDDLSRFMDGKAKATLNGEVFYINAKGERVNE